MCDENRVQELVALIASEGDSEKVAQLAGELERLLSTSEPETLRCEKSA